MRAILVVLVLLVVSFPVQGWADGVGGYLAYHYSDDAEHGIGPAAKYVWVPDPMFRLEGRLSYYAFGKPDLDLVPIEVAGGMNFAINEEWLGYAGLGLGYCLVGANRGDTDNGFDWQIFAGTEWDYGLPFAWFAEIRYMGLEVDVDEVFQQNEGSGSSIDLGGLGVNIGIVWKL